MQDGHRTCVLFSGDWIGAAFAGAGTADCALGLQPLLPHCHFRSEERSTRAVIFHCSLWNKV